MADFINYHLAISKERFLRRSFASAAGLSIREVPFDADIFHGLIERVGGPWGWTRRPKYYFNGTKERLKDSRLFLLQKDDETIGYCLALPGERTEIENFGLFPEHTGRGYGQTFLPLVFAALLSGADTVYLTSRSTNHAKVIPFYRQLGMDVIQAERQQDDLVL